MKRDAYKKTQVVAYEDKTVQLPTSTIVLASISLFRMDSEETRKL